jgi:hypothetical protein
LTGHGARATTAGVASGDPPFGQSSDRPKATAGSRSSTEGVLSEVLRRLIEAGAKNLSAEPVKQLLAEMKIPKDALLHLLTQHLIMQLEETKSSIYSAASRELRQLLERTNLADEIATALTRLSVDVTMQVRFSPKDPSGAASSRIKVVTRSDVPPASEPPASGGS